MAKEVIKAAGVDGLQKSVTEFMDKVRSSFGLLWIKTHEEHRVLHEYVSNVLKKTVHNRETGAAEKYEVWTWDIADGLRRVSIVEGALAFSDPVPKTSGSPDIPLAWLQGMAQEKDGHPVKSADGRIIERENVILILKDYHHYLDPRYRAADVLSRMIRNRLQANKAVCKLITILSPKVEIPLELDKDISVIEFELPDRAVLEKVLAGACESGNVALANRPSGPLKEAIIDAALGMTESQADDAFCLSLTKAKGQFDPAIIRAEKANIVKKSGFLEVVETPESLDTVGGLELLKVWLEGRKNCTTAQARAYGVRSPKGAIFVGPPGTGKSLTAKAIGAAWQRPVLRMDIGALMGEYVGQSEHNMAKALAIAVAVSPCVLWIDEIEKDLSGNKAGTNQQEAHEVSKKVFKQLLTFMQENKADVFLVATANQLASLPDELLRSGRIDGIYWVDLPDAVQREEIIRIHIRKIGRDPHMFDKDMAQLVKACDKFSGAEIEAWIQEGLTTAFNAGHPNIQLQDLLDTVELITPSAVIGAETIAKNRKWALDHKCRMANRKHETSTASAPVAEKGGRKMNIQPPGANDVIIGPQ